MKSEDIEINEQFRLALELLENSSESVFITGRAGTGKSTLLDLFRNTTGKNAAVLAPTGVAALNIKGQTIHSFFRFKPNITPDRVRKLHSENRSSIFRKLDIIIIDEISMVRADLLDCIDRFLRLNGPDENSPFGGIQMAFFGDLYQLPPVVTGNEKEVFQSLYKTPYFFGAKVFESFRMEFIELEKIYRQSDKDFIDLLNSIRNNTISEEGIKLLNSRYQPYFVPPQDDFYVYLTTTNRLAEEINNQRLASITGRLYSFSGFIEGDFAQEYLPAKMELQVKAGSQIMMLNNDSEGRWVNGSIGKIIGFGKSIEEKDVIYAELSDNEKVEITPYTWEIFRFFTDNGRLQSESVGKFTQYPLMLAWAVTIHKGQGKTFDKVIIDIGSGTFAHGQMYVALSRCTTLEGIVLKRPALKSHIWTNIQVMDFLTQYQYNRAEQDKPLDEKIDIINKAIKSETPIEIVYLKPNDEKSIRTVIPKVVGEMEYRNKTYIGMRAFCLTRREMRTFRIDRILEIR